MSCGQRLAITLLGVVVSVTAAAGPQKKSPKKSGGGGAAIVQGFEKHVNQYLEQRKKQAGSLPRATRSATKLKETREEIRAKVQANRAGATQGAFFTPEVAAYFRKQIASTLKGPVGGRVLASLRHGEPLQEIPLRVNQPYPDGVALQSMPPTLLLKLPKLPKELEYRIVGPNLVLLDVEANLVVDILPDAIPAT